ncbi:MAG: hypothetical protein QG600_390 [Patescibacteria group bacterium]|nr:hypothetical protein [Patescibacteria group bacterium]
MERRKYQPVEEHMPQNAAFSHEPKCYPYFRGDVENEQRIIMEYREWKEKGFTAESPLTIVDFPPAQLFTTQDWLDPEKTVRAHLAQQERVDDAFVVKGTLFQHPKPHMGVVPVVLEGNHRTVNALFSRENVTFNTSNISLPTDAQVWRITNLAKKYNDWYAKGL